MTLKRFTLALGRKQVEVSLPEEQILYELLGRPKEGLPNLEKAYLHALDYPIDSPPLRELVKPDGTVTIAVSDITRSWQRNDLTLGWLLDYLNRAGVPDTKITIVIAVGNHRMNTPAEFQEICGAEVCHRVKVLNHNAHDSGNMVRFGKTSRGIDVWLSRLAAEADCVIITGGVVYHYMVGYGGGRKSVLPGLAAVKTIQGNHLLAVSPQKGGGTNPLCVSRRLKGNPQHEDMMEIAAFLKPEFLVNVVTNLAGEICGVFTGNWITAWQAGCELVDFMYGVPITQKADIVVASAGGYPKDINLYQTTKTEDNACYALKPGGVALILADLQDIAEPKEFFEWFEHPDALSQETALRAEFNLPGWVALLQTQLCRDYKMILVTRPENAALAAKARLKVVAGVEEGLDLAYRLCGLKKPQITVMPFAANTLPIYTPS